MLSRLFRFFSWLLLLPLTSQAQGVEWQPKVFDFGAFDEEMGEVRGTFSIINHSSAPVSIVSARANCGCTTPSYARGLVAPGDTAVLTVGFDPKGRPGKFAKYITVDVDTGGIKPSRERLEITGTVIGASNTLRSRYPVEAGKLKLRTSLLAFGEVLKGKCRAMSIAGINPSHDSISPLLSQIPAHISAAVSPNPVPPGEMFVISAIFNSDMVNDWGVMTGRLMLDSTEIVTTAVIREDFSALTPQELAQAPVARLSSELANLGQNDTSAIITLSNLGKSPLVIRQLRADSPSLSVKAKSPSVKPGKSIPITITITPGDNQPINSRISLITNDPMHPLQPIRVVKE